MRDATDCCAIGTGRYIPGMCPICDVDEDSESSDALSWPDCCGIGGMYIDSEDCPLHGRDSRSHDDDEYNEDSDLASSI